MKKIKNFINGELVDPVSKNYFENYNPAIGEVYSLIPDSDNRDIKSAVDAAEKAFPSWSNSPANYRSKILNQIAERIEEKNDEFALAESNDNGKPVHLAKTMDIPRAASNFKFFSSAILQFSSESHSIQNTAINYTLRNPVGIAGCISPWNLPLYLFTWKIAPALAVGNCVIGKPSEITPMTAYLMSEICTEIGLPPGVLNIVHGYGNKVGSAISENRKIPVVSFTGGTKTGKEIARITAPMFKKVSLEMGGKNPNIVFSDCNYDKMMETTIHSSFANQGQICLCGSRIFIERSIYDKFRDDFVKRTKKLKIGDPLEKDTQQGAVVSEIHMEKILSYIKLAKEEKGTIICGGDRVNLDGRCKNGWFVEPTVIEGLTYDCRTNQEEIFGPVVTIMPFDTEEEVLMYANSTQYGLAAIIWTQDLTRAHRMGNNIQSGVVWINCWLIRDLRTPFGGMKNSGLGREGGLEALRFFTEPKNICVDLTE